MSTIPDAVTDDMYTLIFSFLDEKSLVRTGAVCKRWNKLINAHANNDKLLWKTLFERCYSYTPEPLSTFRQAYIDRHRFFKSLQTSAQPTRSLELPLYMNVDTCFNTTHFLFVTGNNDRLSFIHGFLYCFDRITHKEVALFPVSSEQYSKPYIDLVAKDIVAVRFNVGVSTLGEWKVYDVSQKNQAVLLFTTKKILFNYSECASREMILYIDDTQHLCTYNTCTKMAQSLVSIDDKNIIYNTYGYNKLALLTNTHLVLIDLVQNSTESFAYADIGLTVLRDSFNHTISLPVLTQESSLFFFTKNDTLLIGHSTTKFFAFDLKTKKSREIAFPTDKLGMRANEHFLAMRTKNAIHFWNVENFIDAPQRIEDTSDSRLQLIDNEKLLLVNNRTGTATIWNLKTLKCEMTHEIDCEVNMNSSTTLAISNTHSREEGTAWIYLDNVGSRLNVRSISLYIDMRKGTVIAEKKNHPTNAHSLSCTYPFIDRTSYGFVKQKENNSAIEIFDLVTPVATPPVVTTQEESVTPLSWLQNSIISTVKYIFGW